MCKLKIIIILIFLCVLLFLKTKYVKEKYHGRIGIPIAYINLDKNHERNANLLTQFKQYSVEDYHRIPGVDGTQINYISGIVDNIKYKQTNLKDNEKIEQYADNYSKEKYLSPGELGCLLAHIRAIKYAYDNKINPILILEDDISLEVLPLWDYDIPQIIKLFPKDWKIIQLHHLNKNIDKTKLYTKNEIFWSCGAYIINRKGQKMIMDEVNKGLNITNRNDFVADKFVFRLCKPFYTLNLPYFLLSIHELNEKSVIRKNLDGNDFMSKSNIFFRNYYRNKYIEKYKIDSPNRTILEIINNNYYFDTIKYKNIVIIKKHNKNIAIIFSYYSNINENINELRKTYKDIIILLCDFEPFNLKNISLTNNDILVSSKKDKKLLPNINYIYFPYFVFWLFETYNTNLKIEENNYSKFCCFAYSNCNEKFKGVKIRNDFYKLMQKMTNNKVDNFGKCLNTNKNIVGKHPNNKNIFKEYKFVIAIENEPIEGYITEKILNPMLANSIPIYYGAPDISKYFNPKRFVNISDFKNYEDCINHIIYLDNNDEAYNSIINEPIFSNDINILGLKEKLYKQIDDSTVNKK